MLFTLLIIAFCSCLLFFYFGFSKFPVLFPILFFLGIKFILFLFLDSVFSCIFDYRFCIIHSLTLSTVIILINDPQIYGRDSPYWLTDCLFDWLPVSLTDWLLDWLWLTVWLIDWLFDWLTDTVWLTDWLFVWLTELDRPFNP